MKQPCRLTIQHAPKGGAASAMAPLPAMLVALACLCAPAAASDATEPVGSAANYRVGHAAPEPVYYRHTVDIGKVRGAEPRFGPVRSFGATVGYVGGAVDDAAFSVRKRILAAGPTLMWKVPGFLSTSVMLLHESPDPGSGAAPLANAARYTYDLRPMVSAAWSVPVSARWDFQGVANVIASRGLGDMGADAGAETNVDMQLMFDASSAMGYRKNAFRIGVEYQYGHNRFGNTWSGASGRGFKSSTPMLRAEYHFP